MVTEEQLKEWADLTECATRGPWNLFAFDTQAGLVLWSNGEIADTDEDGRFCAAARTALPALIAEVARLKSVIQDYRGMLRAVNDRAAGPCPNCGTARSEE